MALKLLFVVHRYAPFPGGSETYVQNMAEEAHRRGHTVAVVAGQHKGDHNGIHVTNDADILLQQWDLIIVHGGDVDVQNFVLHNITSIRSPVLYLLVLPSNSLVCLQGLHECRLIGCSTIQDWEHCNKHGVTEKAVPIRHGIKWQNSLGQPGFKQRHGIQGRLFVSCGGYYPNKAMRELAAVFERANLDDAILVTTGYDNSNDLMPQRTSRVIPLLIEDRNEVLSAMHDADCMLMHSYTEGFGLVLLEAMLNQTPWIARNIAGAELMQQHGKTYVTDDELVECLKMFNRNQYDIKASYEYVVHNHLIEHTVNDIEAAAMSLR